MLSNPNVIRRCIQEGRPFVKDLAPLDTNGRRFCKQCGRRIEIRAGEVRHALLFGLEKRAQARLTERGLTALKGAVRLQGSAARVPLQNTLAMIQALNLKDKTLEADLEAAFNFVAHECQPDELQAWQIDLKAQARALWRGGTHP